MKTRLLQRNRETNAQIKNQTVAGRAHTLIKMLFPIGLIMIQAMI